MSEYSENLAIVISENGRRFYFFETPLVEGYMLGDTPYREFRKGVKITTHKDDSLATVDAVLTADYAIYYEKRKLWEARGNVVIDRSDGRTLYTQQLFWNEQTRRVYSNVDSKIVRRGSQEVTVGEGFDSDDEFKDWRLRHQQTRMEVQVKPAERSDSTAAARPAGVARTAGTGAARGGGAQMSGARATSPAPSASSSARPGASTTQPFSSRDGEARQTFPLEGRPASTPASRSAQMPPSSTPASRPVEEIRTATPATRLDTFEMAPIQQTDKNVK